MTLCADHRARSSGGHNFTGRYDMHNFLFYLMIAFYVSDFLFEQWLKYLDRSRMNPVMPRELDGIYNTELYANQQMYQRENNRFGRISDGFAFILTTAVLLSGWAGRLDIILRGVTTHFILLPLLYFGVLLTLSAIISAPFDWYDTFVIEKKYGFNRTTRRTFFSDMLKSYALTLTLAAVVLSCVLLAYKYAGDWFWLMAWGSCALISLVLGFFYSEWIVPIFNRQTPLEEGGLRAAIETFARNASFPLQNIFVIDGSRRSTKSNAYFTGFGKKKRIVLFDTLQDDLTTEEIVAILAHEIGHNRKKHTLTGMAISLSSIGLMLWLFSFLIDSLPVAQALGGYTPSFHLNIIGFALLYRPLENLLSLLGNLISRRHEYEADAYTAEHGLGEALISALKKLSSKSLSNLTPHPIVVFFCHSHPTLLQRIARLRGAGAFDKCL